MSKLTMLLVVLAGVLEARADDAPVDLAAHLFGEVPFHACALTTRGVPSPIEALCAEVEVPIDHSKPEAGSLKLAVAWLKPLEKAGALKDPGIVLAGGPGQSSREQAAWVGAVFSELRRHHHLLFVDQRGTGASAPLTCPHEDSTTPQEVADHFNKCRASFKVDPTHFITRDAVEDLEWLRKKLGAVRYDLIGVSYGTRLAQEYARAHPEGVRTMVLDGVVPPTLVLGRGFGQALDDALFNAMGTCQGKCEAPLAVLDEALIQLGAGREVTFDDPYTGEPRTEHFGRQELMQLIHGEAYQPLFISTFPQLFRDARAGHFGRLAAQMHVMENSSGISGGLHYAVACAEDAPQLTDADAEAEAKTRMGRFAIDSYRAVCRDWPKVDAPAARLTPLVSDAPTLLLSGEWDPVTPPAGADLVAKTLSHSKHLVLKGQGHNVITAGCVPRVLAHFLDAGTIDGLDTACISKIKPLPPFTSRTGWNP